MKKIVLFMAMTAIVMASCNEQAKKGSPENSDLLVDNLHGSVSKTEATDYKVDSTGNIGEQDSCCVVINKYDEKGYISEYSSANKSGSEVNKQTFTHYENGAMKNIDISKNGITVTTVNIQVDSKGKYTSAQEFDSAHQLKFYYTGLEQNDYDQLTAMKKFNLDSSLSSTMSSTFNKALYTGGNQKDSTGKVVYSSAIKLDDKNNIIENSTESVMKDSTKKETVKYRYDSYDDKGNWTQRTKMDESGKPILITKRSIAYYKQ